MLMATLDPVEIELPQEGGNNQINITNASEEYLRMSKHPAYKDSTLVQNAAVASRLIVTSSGYLANAINSGADAFTKKTKPAPKPMTFTPTTQARVRKLNNLTEGAVGLSAKTIGQINRHAQNVGAAMTRRGEQQKKAKGGFDKHGRPIDDYKPGLMNKAMMAFSTVADGVDQASRNLLASGSTAATTVVGYRYGEEARQVAGGLAGGVRNVGLVYVDAAGVSRRAVIKSVAKGMVCVIFSFCRFEMQEANSVFSGCWQSSRWRRLGRRWWRRWRCASRSNARRPQSWSCESEASRYGSAWC